MAARYNADDYEDVASRIKRFKADYPDSRIITHALSDPNLKDWVVVRAEVFLTASDLLPAASGLAQEHPGSGANATSWWENAETSGIGRALANCGYSGDKRASREEMQKTERPAYKYPYLAQPSHAPRPAAPDPQSGEIGPCGKCQAPVRFALENGKRERYNADNSLHFKSCGNGPTGYESAGGDIEADPFAGN
jgi:hypothetical protein